MDIEGLGEKTAENLVEQRLVGNPADLYYLGEDDLLSLEGFAEKTTHNLLSAIEASKDRPLERLVSALGIQGVGGVVAGTVARHYRSIDDLAQADCQALEAIEGIGPHTAEAIVSWFASERNQEFVERLREAGARLAQDQPTGQPAGPLEGLTFVITGTLSLPRRETAALIEAQGGRVTSRVSGNTDYLVVGESPGGRKFDRAQELGTPMIDEKRVAEMIGARSGVS
jgi:DNA ligase (NAD+)